MKQRILSATLTLCDFDVVRLWDFVTVFRVLQTEVFHCNHLKSVMGGCCELALCAQPMKLYVNRDVSTPCAYPIA